jgi:hypothetical protein
MSELYKILMGKYDKDVSNFLKTREKAVKDIFKTWRQKILICSMNCRKLEQPTIFSGNRTNYQII